MARILIVGEGGRDRRLAERLLREGHAVRVLAREESQREEIERIGAECHVGTPARLASLRNAAEHVTIACWLLATAAGSPETAAELHGSRVEQFMGMLVDSSVRGVVYEAGGDALPGEVLQAGSRAVLERGALNAIPVAVFDADPLQPDVWLEDALEAVQSLLADGRARS